MNFRAKIAHVNVVLERMLSWAHAFLRACFLERTLSCVHAFLSARFLERTHSWAYNSGFTCKARFAKMSLFADFPTLCNLICFILIWHCTHTQYIFFPSWKLILLRNWVCIAYSAPLSPLFFFHSSQDLYLGSGNLGSRCTTRTKEIGMLASKCPSLAMVTKLYFLLQCHTVVENLSKSLILQHCKTHLQLNPNAPKSRNIRDI